MRISIVTLLVTMILATAAVLSWADEEKDHICFSVLDSNQDGVVTYQEFEKVYGDDKKKYDTVDLDKDGKLTHDEYHDLLGHGNS